MAEMSSYSAGDAAFQVIDLPPTMPLVLPVCRQLGLAQIVDQYCPMKDGDHVSHGEAFEFMISHILQAPHRLPLYELSVWAELHGVSAIYGKPASKFNDHRMGRMLDAICEHIVDIQSAIVTRALQVYDVDARTVHWDMTSILFSDARQQTGLICKGYGGGDIHQRQVQLNMAVTNMGAIPVHYHLVSGRAHQSPLVSPLLEDLKQRVDPSDLIVVADRAGINYETVQVFRKARAHFVGAISVLGDKHKRKLAGVPLTKFKPLRYRSINAPDDCSYAYPTKLRLQPERYDTAISVRALFIYSPRRKQRDREERGEKIAKVQARLDDINQKMHNPKARQYKQRGYAQKQITNAIPDCFGDIVRYELTEADDGSLSLRHWIDDKALQNASRGDGRYIIIHNISGKPTPDHVFELYRGQGQIEARFRNFKQELSVHPLWLKKETRIISLVLLFVIALTIYSLIELLSRRAHLRTSRYPVMTTRELMKRFAALHLVIIRVSGQPAQRMIQTNEEQRAILRQLGFPDPMRYIVIDTS
jgi:transposase